MNKDTKKGRMNEGDKLEFVKNKGWMKKQRKVGWIGRQAGICQT